MAIYIININEKKASGRAFKSLLEQEPSAQLIPLEEYEVAESETLMTAMQSGDQDTLLSFEEGKQEYARLRKRHTK